MTDMSAIPRDTFGQEMEFRIRIKSTAHVPSDILVNTIKKALQVATFYDVIFVKNNPRFNRETIE